MAAVAESFEPLGLRVTSWADLGSLYEVKKPQTPSGVLEDKETRLIRLL